ncbi:MAG: hypothetical protein JWP34_5135 [Massilia sp.]|nr:hypothetical protein [Massilia sp.]
MLQRLNERANAGQRVRSVMSGLWRGDMEVAEELLEAPAREGRDDEWLLVELTPVHVPLRESANTHIDVHTEEGIQLCRCCSPSSLCTALLRVGIGVVCQLLHELRREEQLKEVER